MRQPILDLINDSKHQVWLPQIRKVMQSHAKLTDSVASDVKASILLQIGAMTAAESAITTMMHSATREATNNQNSFQHKMDCIERLLEGANDIVDRYTFASAQVTSLIAHEQSSMSGAWVKRTNASAGLKPSHTTSQKIPWK